MFYEEKSLVGLTPSSLMNEKEKSAEIKGAKWVTPKKKNIEKNKFISNEHQFQTRYRQVSECITKRITRRYLLLAFDGSIS